MKAFERLEALAGAESPTTTLLHRRSSWARHRRARAAPPGARGARGIAGPARSRRARAAVALGCTVNRKRYNRRRVGPVV